ncbi:MAG: DoxX family protein [Paludibacter sp.]|nr:DoxX family protein [Paludibacter sp.]
MTTIQENNKINKAGQFAGNLFLQVGRILFGAVFVFSGFVKAIDPLGSSYKIEDYLRNFGGFFDSMADYAFLLAIALSTVELLIGLSFLFKVHLKLTTLLGLIFMSVMTPLTLYIAIKNPVIDCGCFGDALVISNWTTFFKNVVLISIIILMQVYQSKFRPFLSPKVQHAGAILFIFVGIGLSVYSYRHLPMIDFLPYKIGVNIPKAMVIPENALSDVYKTNFIYEKDGVQKEFTLENYPKGDSSWVFVDQKTELVSKGYKAPVHDFSIMNGQFDDITQQVLNSAGDSYLFIMYDVNETSIKGAQKAEMIYQKYLKTGVKIYALTGSSDADVQKFKDKTDVTFPFWKTDPTTLKTMIRANPGLVKLNKGTITGKWNWRDFE